MHRRPLPRSLPLLHVEGWPDRSPGASLDREVDRNRATKRGAEIDNLSPNPNCIQKSPSWPSALLLPHPFRFRKPRQAWTRRPEKHVGGTAGIEKRATEGEASFRGSTCVGIVFEPPSNVPHRRFRSRQRRSFGSIFPFLSKENHRRNDIDTHAHLLETSGGNPLGGIDWFNGVQGMVFKCISRIQWAELSCKRCSNRRHGCMRDKSSVRSSDSHFQKCNHSKYSLQRTPYQLVCHSISKDDTNHSSPRVAKQ